MRKVDLSKVYRLLYPSVPAIVAATLKGKTTAMPVVSLISLSNDPPLIGVSSSPSHATFQMIMEARCFSVSWLGRRHTGAVEFLGSYSGRDLRDKLSGSGLRHRTKGSPRVPLITGSSAFLICSVDEVKRFGDHELVVGRVREARAEPDFHDYWTFKTYKPILYAGLQRSAQDFNDLRRS